MASAAAAFDGDLAQDSRGFWAPRHAEGDSWHGDILLQKTDTLARSTQPESAVSDDSPFSPRIGQAQSTSTGDADEPKWITSTLRSVEKLLALEANWDSYGAPRVDRGALNNALQLLYWAASSRTPAPALVPMGNGGVQIEWHENGLDVEVYCHPSDATVGLFVQDHRDGTEVEIRVFADVTPLSKALRRLTDRADHEAGAR